MKKTSLVSLVSVVTIGFTLAGGATGETKSFLKYMEGSNVQKKTVEKLGYISVSDMKVTKDADGNVTKK